jgi:hypothetical protein
MRPDLDVVAEEINRLDSPIHGSLRTYGDWFGKPLDNDHRVRSARAEGHRLIIDFDDDETLSVWNPRGITVSVDAFRIDAADRVRWEWFYHGRRKSPENRYVEEHVVVRDRVQATTTADWYELSRESSVDEPAVELRNR